MRGGVQLQPADRREGATLQAPVDRDVFGGPAIAGDPLDIENGVVDRIDETGGGQRQGRAGESDRPRQGEESQCRATRLTVRRTLWNRASLLYADDRGNAPSIDPGSPLPPAVRAAARRGRDRLCKALLQPARFARGLVRRQSRVARRPRSKSTLRAWLAQTLEWHREKELGRYATFLRELSTEVAQPSGRGAYQRALDRVEGFAQDFTAQTAPQAARLLMELSPAQVEEFLANLEEKSNERAEENRDALRDGTWQAKRVKDTQRQVKRWTGAITEEQKVLVREMAQHIQPTTPDWLESQRQWRAALGDALREAFSNRDNAEKRILQLLREPDTQWTAQYKTKEAGNREQMLSLLAALDASLTPAQRGRMQRELTTLAERLEALTEE